MYYIYTNVLAYEHIIVRSKNAIAWETHLHTLMQLQTAKPTNANNHMSPTSIVLYWLLKLMLTYDHLVKRR